MSGGELKTEKPTPKRIADAREKGMVAKSQDFNAALLLTAATGMLIYTGGYTWQTLSGIMQQSFLNLAHHRSFSIQTVNVLSVSMLQSIGLLLLPFLLTLVTVGVFSNLIQVRPLFTLKPLMPSLDKINPLEGVKRLFSMRSVVEVVKALIKMSIIGTCAFWILQSHQQELLSLGAMKLDLVNLSLGLNQLLGVLGQVAWWSCILFLILGLLDWRYQAYELEKKLRMSRQEIKDERRDQEGDPAIKSRIRQMGIQMSRKKQLVAVKTADVVITNPTHISIAIQYDPDIAPAPRVVAKGQEHFAFKIREIAKEHKVPMVENKPLARSLYQSVEVDRMIPPELFVAVAEVLAYVYSKNKGRKPKGFGVSS